MTEEQKQKMAEGRAKARAAKLAEQSETTEKDQVAVEKAEEKTFSEDEVKRMIREALETERKEHPATVVMAKPEEMVTIMFMDEVAPDNVLSLGEFGSLNNAGSTISIPKKDFASHFLTPMRREMLNKRSLIVCDGLAEEERTRYGVEYRDGELMDMQAFDRMLDFDDDKICGVFEKLCPEHQRMVARRFITAAEKGDNRVSRGKVERMQEISKKADPKGMFTVVLESMNKL